MYNKNMKLWEEKNSTEVLNLSETSGKNAASDIISKTERKLIAKRWLAIIPAKTAGVYQIKNKNNGRYYIGSAKDLKKRCKDHLSELIRNVHCNKKLQRDWNKYGYKDYEFSILEICKAEDRYKIEQKYLDIGFSAPKLFFNIIPVALSGEIREYPAALRKRWSEKQRDHTKYNFYNFYTEESIYCDVYALIEKYPDLPKGCLGNVSKGRNWSAKGWTLEKTFKEQKIKNGRVWRFFQRKIKNKKAIDLSTIYHLVNIETKEEFIGSKSEFVKKYYCKGIEEGFDILIERRGIISRSWVLKERVEEVMAGETVVSKRILSTFNKIYEPKTYSLINVNTLEEFSGTESDFENKHKAFYGFHVRMVFLKKKFSHRFWILKENYNKFLNDNSSICRSLRSKAKRENGNLVIALVDFKTGNTFEGTHKELIKMLGKRVTIFFSSPKVCQNSLVRKDKLNKLFDSQLSSYGVKRKELSKLPFYQQFLEKHQNNQLLINNASSEPSLVALA